MSLVYEMYYNNNDILINRHYNILDNGCLSYSWETIGMRKSQQGSDKSLNSFVIAKIKDESGTG